MRRFLTVILLLCFCLCSCGRRPAPPPRTLLDRLLGALPIGAGVIYDSSLPENHGQYLDPLLFRALYARADGTDDREDIAAAALFLGGSGEVHREIGIFACRGSDSASEVSALCRARASLIASLAETEPKVVVYGDTVVLLAVPDPDLALRLLDRLLA